MTGRKETSQNKGTLSLKKTREKLNHRCKVPEKRSVPHMMGSRCGGTFFNPLKGAKGGTRLRSRFKWWGRKPKKGNNTGGKREKIPALYREKAGDWKKKWRNKKSSEQGGLVGDAWDTGRCCLVTGFASLSDFANVQTTEERGRHGKTVGANRFRGGK